jgi:RNA polymerase primary sigma factor
MEEGSLQAYLTEIEAYPPLGPDEERELAARIRARDHEALDLLVRSNLRYVVMIADEFLGEGISRADLINEGNLGLIRAAHRWDESTGHRFADVADGWIRDAIREALAEQSRILTRVTPPPPGDSPTAT